MKRLLAAASLFVLIGSTMALAQVDPNVEQGVHPFGSYDASQVDTVNLQNGGLSVKIPLFSYPERGKAGATVELVMSSKQWVVQLTCNQFTEDCTGAWELNPILSLTGQQRIYPNPVGIGLVIDDGVPETGLSYQMKELPNGRWVESGSRVAIESDGSSHPIYGGTSGSPLGATADASGIVSNPTGVLFSRTGVTNESANDIEDPNGNIEADSAGDDSIGRSAVYSAFKNAQTLSLNGTNLTGCGGSLTISDIKLVTFPGPNNTTRQLKLCSAGINGATDFHQTYGTLITEGTYGGNVLQSVALYDGNSWSTSPVWVFQYSNMQTDANGVNVNYIDLTQIKFPTGGTISYQWGMGWLNSECSSYANISRYLIQRTVSANDGSPNQVSTYTTTSPQPVVVANYNGSVSSGNEKSYIQHYFSPAVPNTVACNYYEWKTVFHDLSSGSDQILKTIQTDYSGIQDPFYPENPANFNVNVEPIRVTTTLPNGMVSKVETDYDSTLSIEYWDSNATDDNGTLGAFETVSGLSRGLVLQKREYGLGSGAPGPLVRCTAYDYEALDNSAYMNANLLDLPSSVKVYAGACGSGTLVSQTTYGYDEGTLQPSGVTTQRDSSLPNPGVRGNQTSVHKWLNTGGTISTFTKYYDTGMPYQSTDANGNTTTYTYSSTYAGGLLTQTQMPDTGSPVSHHIVKAGYDFNTGLMTSYTDQNSNTTTFAFDPLSRMTSASFPDGGLTSLSYPDFNTVVESVLDGKTTTTKFDGLGRKSHVIVNDSPQNDTVDYTYDWAGRLASVSNPYRTTSDATYGITAFAYDSLDRKTLQTQPDGSTLTWGYNGNVTDSYDETGKHWQRTTDAFGNLIQVKEPDNSNNPTIETDYQYDALNNLIRVDQWGGPSGSAGDRIRSFTYDSLSRLLSSTNPESGTVSYSYDSNGNIQTKKDARGIVESFTGYDAINRPAHVRFSDGTVGRDFTYDQSYVWSTGLNNPIGKLTWGGTSDGKSGAIYGYDAMGRVALQGVCTPSTCGIIALLTYATYDHAGDLKTLTYPDGRLVTNSYDSSQHLTDVQYTSWNGTSVNYNYISGATYMPNGSPQSITYGNGAIEAHTWNKRLQPLESAVQADVGGTLQNVYDKYYCYGLADAQCPAIGADNGDILRVLDLHANARSQGFSYDNLNRLTAFNTGDQSMAQSFAYDPWGNMTQAGTQAFQTAYTGNNQINSSGFAYDAAGDLTQTNFGVPQSYTYDALGQITNYNSGAATYTYDAMGQRTRKNAAGTWTEYIYWQGVPIAEKNADGSWSDYIYASGKRIARADSFDARIHLNGTMCSNCGWQFAIFQTNWGAGHVVQNGDKLYLRQFETTPACSGIDLAFSDGTRMFPTAVDQDGYGADEDQVHNQWHDRMIDLSQYAGKSITSASLIAEGCTAAGDWDFWVSDVALVSPDGTVMPFYGRQPSMRLNMSNSGSGVTNQMYTIEAINTTMDAELPANTTTYYVNDQINSARLTLAAGGWPVAMDTYYPFGVEPDPPTDRDHYKFTGKERDAESGNDYFGARYYASTMGRFLSPDWSDTPQAMPYADLSNPQSFNRYVYLNDNPVGSVDADGHEPCGPGSGVIDQGNRAAQQKAPCPNSTSDPKQNTNLQQGDARGSNQPTVRGDKGFTIGFGYGGNAEAGVGKAGAAIGGNINASMSFDAGNGHVSAAIVDNHGATAYADTKVAQSGTHQDGTPSIVGVGVGITGTSFVSNATAGTQLVGPFHTVQLNLPFISMQVSTDGGGTKVFSVSAGPSISFSYTNMTTETTVGCITGCHP